MKEMIDKIGEKMVQKMRLVNMQVNGKICIYDDNVRTNPFVSEFAGMKQMLRVMDIDFEIEWNDNVTEMTAITVMGKRFTV